MNVKNFIKNNLWKVNYVVPFVNKYRRSEKGTVFFAKKLLSYYASMKPVKGNGKRTVGTDTKKLFETIKVSGVNPESRFVYFIDESKTIAAPGIILSNFTLDYNLIVNGTFDDLYAKAKGEDEYGIQTKAVYDGLETLRNRIVENLKKEDASKGKINQFEKMFSSKVDSLEEAFQRILFFNQCLWQTRHRLNGFGRLDKILIDLYENDLKNGTETKESVHALIQDFLTQISKYYEYKSDALLGDIGQIIIVGGLNPDGTYLVNDLSYIFLEEQSKLNKPDPKVLVRCSEKMPEDLLNKAVSCLNGKNGSPLFSNDDIVIPALLNYAKNKEDAYDYATSACWEPFIIGKSNTE